MGMFDSPAGIGGIIGGLAGGFGGNNPAPITRTSTFTPWNAQYWGPTQDAAMDLGKTNKLNMPSVPQLSGVPDLASEGAATNWADRIVGRMQQSFADPNGPLSQIRSEFNATQPGGSSRQGIAEGIAAGREGVAEGDTRAAIMNAIYPTNLNYNLQKALTDISNQQWNYGQNVGQAQAQFQAPWTNLLNQASVVNSASGKGGTMNETTQLPSTPAWQTALGGALMGSQLGGMMGGPGGGGGGMPWWFGGGPMEGGGGYMNLLGGGAAAGGAMEMGGMSLADMLAAGMIAL